MNNPWKLIFVVLFIREEITAAQSSKNNCTKYDLTNVLNDAILKLFKGTDFFEKLESQIILKDLKYTSGIHDAYKINNTEKLQPFGDTINLPWLHTLRLIYGPLIGGENPPNTSTIRWDFLQNRFRMFYAELYYAIHGHVQVEELSSSYRYRDDDGRISKFELDHNKYKNFSITATRRPTKPSCNENIVIDTSYDCLKNPQGIKLAKHRKLSYKRHLKLIYIIGSELPSIMHHFFFKVGNFNTLLGEIFNLNPKQHIISACPDFLINEQRYYYLLPDINFMYMSFKNITIRGLSNFESYTNLKSYIYRSMWSDHIFVYTLHVKDVRGNMTLESGFDHLPHFQLNFFIPNLNIWFVPKNKQFRVEAHNYSIVEDTPQDPTMISSWLSKYSTSIIQLLQSAMTDLMMPMEKNNAIPSSPQLAEMEASFGEILKNCTI